MKTEYKIIAGIGAAAAAYLIYKNYFGNGQQEGFNSVNTTGENIGGAIVSGGVGIATGAGKEAAKTADSVINYFFPQNYDSNQYTAKVSSETEYYDLNGNRIYPQKQQESLFVPPAQNSSSMYLNPKGDTRLFFGNQSKAPLSTQVNNFTKAMAPPQSYTASSKSSSITTKTLIKPITPPPKIPAQNSSSMYLNMKGDSRLNLPQSYLIKN